MSAYIYLCVQVFDKTTVQQFYVFCWFVGCDKVVISSLEIINLLKSFDTNAVSYVIWFYVLIWITPCRVTSLVTSV